MFVVYDFVSFVNIAVLFEVEFMASRNIFLFSKIIFLNNTTSKYHLETQTLVAWVASSCLITTLLAPIKFCL